MSTYKFTRHPPPISIYTRFQVKNSMRAIRTPRVAKAWRTRKLMNLTAFFRNRFYEIDRWYKARIEKPVTYPTCYTIEPENFHRSLEERLADMKIESEPIDIGMAFDSRIPTQADARKGVDVELERLARLRKLCLNPAEIENDPINEQIRVKILQSTAKHFGIFRDLFHPDAFFYPVVNLKISYPVQGRPDAAHPVYSGNDLSPEETKDKPEVRFKANENDHFTLLMVNPDGCMYEENKDVLHWLICNIPGKQIEKGDILCQYMQPLPFRGSGWHRIVFVLFKQEGISKELSQTIKNCETLNDRTFSTSEFYLKNQDFLTPVGLSFFQSSWDNSCTEYLHKRLGIEQPFYKFEWPEPHFEQQEEFPEEYKSFNEYLDNYRNYKDIDKEILLKRLKNRSPFKADDPKLKFPNLFYNEDIKLPTWLRVEKVKEREGYGKYRGIYENRLD